jgi:hypothetical protein
MGENDSKVLGASTSEQPKKTFEFNRQGYAYGLSMNGKVFLCGDYG